ncbi:hypothetical protein A3K86_13260 [Photobacterium jeanii]|uniref:PglD N-terminal domain-containing protein n=1 Tax=Photobacterium jeanii TaxID=858640 RepID=A0A178K893_9GAMM|nr:acetyltransferase [Photobacterium jeanii]OAN13550.1 hypothetical protein A3K86_13260 [Photobacterium jeanii]PST88665.1 shikimate dehydrogenase [Photobacterium jeanii]
MNNLESVQAAETKLPHLILGAGGHASVLVDILRQQRTEIAGLVSPDLQVTDAVLRDSLHAIPCFADDDDVMQFQPETVVLVNGIGALPRQGLRNKLFQHFSRQGYCFASVISSQALVSPYAQLGHGVQVMPGAIIQAGAVIGDNSIINSGAIVEHDCQIGAHCHIAPGATLCGQVNVAANSFIGARAVVIQNLMIEENVVVAAGARVHRDVLAGETYI